MQNNIKPCLWFDNNAREAAEFYCSLFKNSKITSENQFMVAFDLNGAEIMGMNGGPMYKINPSISLFAVCESIDKTNQLWDKLFNGGSEMMTIDKYPWSERYGWLIDKFGMTWQISVVNNPEDKESIRPSMLFTNDLFGKAESAINFYKTIFNNSETEIILHYPEGDVNAGKVLYSEFKLNNYGIIAMDGPGVHDFSFNEGVSFMVECNTQDEIDHYWSKLTEGGHENRCGWLKDRFGVCWQIVPAVLGKLMSDPDKAARVGPVLMKMVKLDLAALENA